MNFDNFYLVYCNNMVIGKWKNNKKVKSEKDMNSNTFGTFTTYRDLVWGKIEAENVSTVVKLPSLNTIDVKL